MIDSAVVLAAGRGKRMGDITADLPKPMLPVQGRPLLEHVMERLAEAGVRRFLIVTGYRHETIESHFRQWRRPVEFRIQDPIDGTGSAARLGREFAGDRPFLLTFGDILCDSTAYLRCAETLAPDVAAVLGVRDLDDPFRAAAVYADGSRVTSVIEKPPPGSSTTRWTSAGLYAMRPVVFDYLDRLELSPRNEYEITSIFDQMIADGLEVRMSPMDGNWRDVGRPEDLAAVNAQSMPEALDHPDQHGPADDEHG